MESNEYPRGDRYVCFDASPLIHYADAQRIPDLASWFSADTCFVPQVVLQSEIPRGIAEHPESRAILEASWLQCAVVNEDDFEFIVTLRKLWGSPGNRDYGEAEVVSLCRRYGWTAIMNDGRGRAAARRHGVASVCTGALLAGVAAEGILSADSAWALHGTLEAGFERPMILPATEEFRPAFDRTVAAIQRWVNDHPDTVWPATLAMTPAIDDILGRAVGLARG